MPVLLLIAAGTVVVSGVTSVALMLRRETPHLPEDHHFASDPLDKNSLRVVRHLTAEERLALKAAFLAGDDFQWMVSGKKLLDENDKANHRDLTFYLVECVVRFAEEYGHVIVARDPETKQYLGSICLLPPYSSQQNRKIHFLWTVLQLGVPPPPTQMGAETSARFNAFQKVLEEQHEEIMQHIPQYWCVLNLGVSPAAQGKGVGRKLIAAAAELAGDLPMYLECNDDNVLFYQKQGFTLAKQFLITPKENIEDAMPLPYNGMVHVKSELAEL